VTRKILRRRHVASSTLCREIALHASYLLILSQRLLLLDVQFAYILVTQNNNIQHC